MWSHSACVCVCVPARVCVCLSALWCPQHTFYTRTHSFGSGEDRRTGRTDRLPRAHYKCEATSASSSASVDRWCHRWEGLYIHFPPLPQSPWLPVFSFQFISSSLRVNWSTTRGSRRKWDDLWSTNLMCLWINGERNTRHREKRRRRGGVQADRCLWFFKCVCACTVVGEVRAVYVREKNLLFTVCEWLSEYLFRYCFLCLWKRIKPLSWSILCMFMHTMWYRRDCIVPLKVFPILSLPPLFLY